MIPRTHRPGLLGAEGGDVPGPDGAIEPERQVGGPFGTVVLPRLGVFASEALLHFAIGDLDGPARRVALHDLGIGRLVVIGDEEVVAHDAGGVPDNDQGDESLLVHRVPQHPGRPHQRGDHLAPAVVFDGREGIVSQTCGHRFGCLESRPALARSSPLPGP